MKRRYYLLTALLVITAWVMISRLNGVVIEQLNDTGLVRITVNFYVPVIQKDVENKIHLESERPGMKFLKTVRWIDDKTLEIYALEKGLPRGFKTRLYIEPLKTAIPGVYKSVKVYYRVNIRPFLTEISSPVPSRGPVVLSFSTPVSGEELSKYLKADFDFTLRPYYIPLAIGKLFRDTSWWQVIPREPLEPGRRYGIRFEGGGSAMTGFNRWFDVAEIPKVVSTAPRDGENNVMPYTVLTVNFDQEMQEVSIKVNHMTGDVRVNGKTAEFKPHSVFLPGKSYEVTVQGRSVYGEKMKPYNFKFVTADMGDRLWVEVNLRSLQKVVVYRGGKIVKTMLASGGRPGPETETPLGYFTIKDRGARFWSERFGQGAFYWVRIKDNYLFHSMPRDRDWNIIGEEYEKLGIPASHGCIRLKDEDAKWFYENIPEGTLVIIHD
ncbi:L,D-transpeptidase family protein [Thermosediminibacter litoriperuensis]|uniref:Lipoprotein-anchoring transpeptidase ErfK/SrfK n=1 Tax=Thermosediminibacter litoriperuensis TaxID=291989 RepID=A0A5S5AXB6_9FIRM|nr:L,D-transpeptidase family protein [Thermosediminibacter litoriperuensis]TYP56722.1 lipoprotein-anchoring transpeptidase ErfK/SrfK [Thermosediminibacter litoriperuensis]